MGPAHPLHSARIYPSTTEPALDREKLNWWLTLFANLGVLCGLVFVGLEIRQNTSQLRADAAYSITESVNQLNSDISGDESLADLILRGEANLDSLNPVERSRFAAYQFARLNIAEYILDLETEGVSDLNFRFADFLVNEYLTKPGLQSFILSLDDIWAGSDELYSRLTGR